MLIEAELHDLLKGDIPYFWIDGASGDLMHSTGLIKKRFGLKTFDALAKRYAHWRNRDFERDMRPIICRMVRGNLQPAT